MLNASNRDASKRGSVRFIATCDDSNGIDTVRFGRVTLFILIFCRFSVHLYISRNIPSISPLSVAPHRRYRRFLSKQTHRCTLEQFTHWSTMWTTARRRRRPSPSSAVPSLLSMDTHHKNRIMCRQLMVGIGLFYIFLKSFLCSFLC